MGSPRQDWEEHYDSWAQGEVAKAGYQKVARGIVWLELGVCS